MPIRTSLLILQISFLSCHSGTEKQAAVLKHNDNKQPIELEVKSYQRGQYHNYNAVICTLALTNHTSRNLTYMNMSCSYDAAYCSNYQNLFTYPEGCNKNVPYLYILGPDESRIRTLNFIFDSTALLPAHTPVRFGFHLVKTDTIPWKNVLEILHDTSNTIWSKSVEL